MPLLLCPGQNGDGRLLYEQPGWHALAREQGLEEESLQEQSPAAELTPESRRGYFYPESGSHERLIGRLTPRYGKNFQLVVFGYSGGAHFAHRFVHRHPEKVQVWAAYSAGWWDDPPAARPTALGAAPASAAPGTPAAPTATIPTGLAAFPPGLILCGADDPRRAACVDYFLACRRQHLPVCWAQVPHSGHEIAPAGREFAQIFLRRTLLRLKQGALRPPDPMPAAGPWPAAGAGIRVTYTLPADAAHPVTAWFPDHETVAAWRRLTPPAGEILREEGE